MKTETEILQDQLVDLQKQINALTKRVRGIECDNDEQDHKITWVEDDVRKLKSDVEDLERDR